MQGVTKKWKELMQHAFFKVLSVQELTGILRSFDRLPPESVSLDAADDHVLARDIVAGENLPAEHRASMDGFAVRAADLFGATEGNPAYLDLDGHCEIDAMPHGTLQPGHCLGIVTGGTLPDVDFGFVLFL